MSESKISFLNSLFSPNFQMVLPYLYILNISTFIPSIYELFTIHDKNKLILLENILLKKPYFCCFIVIFILLIYYSFLTFIIKNILGIDLSHKFKYHEKLFSKAELIYSSPISFFILVYLSDELDLKNPIDFCFTYLIGLYHFLSLIFIIKYLEVKFIKSDRDLLLEYLYYITIILSTILFTLVIYILISKSNNILYKYIIISKGIYLILKIIEIITIRHTGYFVSLISNDEKESWLISIIKRKIHLSLISRLFLFYKYSFILIYSKKNSFSCDLYISLMLIDLGFKCVNDYRIYEAQKDFYRYLMANPENNYDEKSNDICKICETKLMKKIKLQCGHSAHLVCIANLYKKGKHNCPICGQNISINQSPLLKYHGNETINNVNYVINLPFLFTFEIEVNFDEEIC